ncbi:MAG: glycosyltransferase family 4 protein [Isosphaeraceae bacterium]
MSATGPDYALVTGDFVTTGGMDRANFALASYLARQGRGVHLVAHRVDPTLLAEPTVTFHRVPKPLNSYWLAEPLLDRRGRQVAARVAKGGGRVVVNGGNCLWGDVNWVHYVHAAWAPRAGGGTLRRARRALYHRTALRAERRALNRARFVVTNSDQTRQVVIDRLGLPPERVRTIYYGTDPGRFRPATPDERAAARGRLGWNDERPTVAFVGALGDLRKGLDSLLNAWKRLASDPTWDARLVVVGTGANLAQLREEAAGLGGSVEFLGFRTDVPEVLQACDALVSPTRYEAYGLNVQEALCCGLPALVSRTAGVAERYPDELQDLLIPDPDDPEGLADRLRRWRAGREAIQDAVNRLAARLRSTTWDDMAAQIVQAVETPGR